MYTDFELSFEQSEGRLIFFLFSGGQTLASGKKKLSEIQPSLEIALKSYEYEANEQEVIDPWVTVGTKVLGAKLFSILLDHSPARLTIDVTSSVDESLYDLFRMAPWEQVTMSFAKDPDKKTPLLVDDQHVTLTDVRIAVSNDYFAESIVGLEAVPPKMDFHSEQDDQSATGTLFPVWFGTNRKIDEVGGRIMEDPKQLNLTTLTNGKCLVHIPKNHRRGELVSPWYRPRSGLTALEITGIELVDDLCDSIKKEIDSNDEQNHLLFIHGFNNSFQDAILRAGQLGFDLGIDGATMAFSWPSHKIFPYLSRYTGDGERITGCRSAIEAMFQTLTGLSGRLHVIAHSMGNRGLLAAWKNSFSNINDADSLKLGQVVFAAPDVLQDTFRTETKGVTDFCERATIYASHYDRALGLSRLLSRTPRAGLLPPAIELEDIDTIETPFKADLLGHSYFAKAIPVLEDIATMIEKNLPPGERHGLSQADPEKGTWSFDLNAS